MEALVTRQTLKAADLIQTQEETITACTDS